MGARARDSVATARHGYTLVELLAVIVILSMTAGAVMVSWEAMLPNQRLNSDVRDLTARLYAARSDSIARSAQFRMHYQIDENRYWVTTPFRLGGGLAAADEERMRIDLTKLRDGVEIASVTIDGVDYTDGEVFVRFDPLGGCNDHTVVLYQRPFERYFTIEVLGLTGLIHFHDGIFTRDLARDEDFN
jgi:prepilin-type N-terminal cleavage/methylation domain-containing protein